ncbi:MAG: ribosomal L7Ae/L30e/S12e/Gadd45 family protein, partial [Alphaproteobacteria bacterium]|nr:ribosomal L7Ae/L30e/S12e/Gadd45 family protein [Alphaproteobacteria bacterium]
DWVNLARKAGALVTGFEKVKASIVKNKAAFVIMATDVADDGSEKIEAIAQNLEILKVYERKDLDEALNKENTVYVAVLKSDIASKVLEHVKRYQTFLEN